MEAPINFALSRVELKSPFRKAVFLKILNGAPVSFSFLTIEEVWSSSRTTPVAAILKSAYREAQRGFQL